MALHEFDNGICTTCDDEMLDEDSAALLQALNELDGPLGDAHRAAWDPAKHVRNPKGPGGGRFRSNVDKLKDAITAHKAGTGKGHPFDGFDREQLRKVAKERGIELKRGEGRDSIAAKLLGHLDGGQQAPTPIEVPKKPDGPSTAPKALVKEANEHTTGTAHIPTLSADSPGLKRYQELGKYVNDHLRGVADKKMQRIPKETSDQIVSDLDGLFDGIKPTTGDSVVWRGLVEPETLKQQRAIFGDGSAVGKSFTDAAFGSTAASKHSAETFAGIGGPSTGGRTLVKINVPAGSKAVKIEGNLERENEVLLPRGYTLHVTKDDIGTDGIRRMEADLIEPGSAKPGAPKPKAKVKVKEPEPLSWMDTPQDWGDLPVGQSAPSPWGNEPNPWASFEPHKPAEPAKKIKIDPGKGANGREALDAAPVALGPAGFDRGGDGLDSGALETYRGETYEEINDDLRSGRTGSSHDATIKAIDVAMSHSKLANGVTVHRGVLNLDMFQDVDTSKSLVGMEYLERAYTSTTADPAVIGDFHAPKGAVLNIYAPAGTQAVQLSNFGPEPAPGLRRPPTDEAELLLQRGLTYRVTKDHTVDGVRQLDVEVVP